MPIQAQHIKTYDLYLFASDGGVILGWHSFEARNDEAALEIAQPLVTQPPVELWQDSTLVKRWDQLPLVECPQSKADVGFLPGALKGQS